MTAAESWISCKQHSKRVSAYSAVRELEDKVADVCHLPPWLENLIATSQEAREPHWSTERRTRIRRLEAAPTVIKQQHMITTCGKLPLAVRQSDDATTAGAVTCAGLNRQAHRNANSALADELPSQERSRASRSTSAMRAPRREWQQIAPCQHAS